MPVPDHLRSEIGHYLIGHKVKALRLRRSMGLMQLGERTGLSPALLSKIENSKLVPTVPTLLRIAMVFNVTLDHFFHDEHRHRVISITMREDRERSDGSQLIEEDLCHLTRLDLGVGDRKFLPYLAEFFPKAETGGRSHMHQGFEFIHVLSGTLDLMIGADENILHPGDSIYFDSNLRHSYKRASKERCTALMVVAYPERPLAERRVDRLEGVHSIRQPLHTAGNGKRPLVQRFALSENGRFPANKPLQPSA
jgi:transcriptional regulator with XRE-family HTH domain